ncbi:hypothetical protein DB30_05268 [Enhygromyxa salina]|uniref:Uncharacterized protein n=1 Tax=Enhygromyxa salina TaxID=215803 RepID=A0A0C1ZXB8_9BACT|nr:hypothetical protein DB30_05268 [Enhygromyxa salina]
MLELGCGLRHAKAKPSEYPGERGWLGSPRAGTWARSISRCNPTLDPASPKRRELERAGFEIADPVASTSCEQRTIREQGVSRLVRKSAGVGV